MDLSLRGILPSSSPSFSERRGISRPSRLGLSEIIPPAQFPFYSARKILPCRSSPTSRPLTYTPAPVPFIRRPMPSVFSLGSPPSLAVSHPPEHRAPSPNDAFLEPTRGFLFLSCSFHFKEAFRLPSPNARLHSKEPTPFCPKCLEGTACISWIGPLSNAGD